MKKSKIIRTRIAKLHNAKWVSLCVFVSFIFMQTENWKPVNGYNGIYEVSNTGKIRSIDRVIPYKNGCNRPTKGTLSFLRLGSNGYHSVGLWKENKEKRFSVHRLVAESFIPNPDNKSQVNHKNGIKTDNDISNLEWVTKSENAIHYYRVLRKKQLA